MSRFIVKFRNDNPDSMGYGDFLSFQTEQEADDPKGARPKAWFALAFHDGEIPREALPNIYKTLDDIRKKKIDIEIRKGISRCWNRYRDYIPVFIKMADKPKPPTVQGQFDFMSQKPPPFKRMTDSKLRSALDKLI